MAQPSQPAYHCVYDVLPSSNDPSPEQAQRGEREKFDFAFIQANKQDELAYFYAVLDLARERAVIAVDNVERDGKIVSAEAMEKDDLVKGTGELVEATGKMEGIEATAIQRVGEKNYAGFLVAIKNKGITINDQRST
ncbi:O-methyltransferase [Penicillium odoratum]|uniref:O-methyltransferase n=1 Tax=Penicillium odoratum TaxID=1167516 RepID=UPI002547BFE4|nr:O-methyltransferase [Penicillium odoratum]KAJ5777617.1 O-methyltransferase [Penicillium odoratum]